MGRKLIFYLVLWLEDPKLLKFLITRPIGFHHHSESSSHIRRNLTITHALLSSRWLPKCGSLPSLLSSLLWWPFTSFFIAAFLKNQTAAQSASHTLQSISFRKVFVTILKILKLVLRSSIKSLILFQAWDRRIPVGSSSASWPALGVSAAFFSSKFTAVPSPLTWPCPALTNQ